MDLVDSGIYGEEVGSREEIKCMMLTWVEKLAEWNDKKGGDEYKAGVIAYHGACGVAVRAWPRSG